ncbi:hypothetical protein QJS10_CPA07g00238 [Acorus calamus]|uniref:ARM repeat superfamily protein n=1 Tax=Acorus calamus TaxID=4465 RepID=A0AAV9EDM1_ACOCL|nr:hypothetical protein QJS10_CPA07g00238 [Acorus calamus]
MSTMEDQFQVSKRFSPSRLQFGGPSTSQRLQRSSSAKNKPPEPLRRAVADCLSSSAPSSYSSEAARTLRDYIAAPSTIDMAYGVLLEHTLAERDRSPAVVARCVALLKRYLLRYVPKVQTLRQIDLFCLNLIAEYDSVTYGRTSLWSRSLGEQSGAMVTSGNILSPSTAANFASRSLLKSLKFVRSLVAQHIPKLKPAAFSGGSASAKQALPTLSSLLRRSFNAQLGAEIADGRESPKRKEVSSLSVLGSSNYERVNDGDDIKYISIDALKWRWPGDREHQLPSFVTESDGFPRPQDIRTHGLLEVGAAALLVGDTEAKMKDQSWRYTGIQKIPDIDQLLQPSSITTATNFASAGSHLKAITAAKRMKPGPHQVWMDAPVSTFRPQARPLFQYRHYSEQQPLRLNPAEVGDIIAAVCSETSSPNLKHMTMSSRLSNHSGKPSMDVAASVLIKLIIDMYVLDSETAAPLTISMLEEMLLSPRAACRVRVFDLILNLGVHAHLLEPVLSDDPPAIEEDDSSQEPYINSEGQLVTLVHQNTESFVQNKISTAIDKFESWIFVILCRVLLLLVQIEEREEIVWSSALSCLFYFVCNRGKIWRYRLEGLDIRVVKVLLEISREHAWAEAVHCKLIGMLANMFYQLSDAPPTSAAIGPTFIAERVNLLGGIEFICLEYSRANLRDEKRNLFTVLFDYVLYQINESCSVDGGSFGIDEIQFIATMLILVDAPEAFYVAVKHGVEGIGEILRRSISAALSKSPNYERLDLLLEKITKKFDTIITNFTRLDNEFSYMICITKSNKSLERIEDQLIDSEISMKVKFSWATLHSLLHSERSAYRHNGYIWLVELLVSEISEEGEKSIWLNIRNLQQQIGIAGSKDSSKRSSVPLSVWILCRLLNSENNVVRWGFLFVVEKLLVRCKLLLDENEMQHLGREDMAAYVLGDKCLEKAIAVVDIMSSSLLLVYQINETDRINILKMCDMLFSQLSLRRLPSHGTPFEDLTTPAKNSSKKDDSGGYNEPGLHNLLKVKSVVKASFLAVRALGPAMVTFL